MATSNANNGIRMIGAALRGQSTRTSRIVAAKMPQKMIATTGWYR